MAVGSNPSRDSAKYSAASARSQLPREENSHFLCADFCMGKNAGVMGEGGSSTGVSEANLYSLKRVASSDEVVRSALYLAFTSCSRASRLERFHAGAQRKP